MAYSRFSRRRPYSRRPRVFGSYRRSRFSRARPTFRVGSYRRKSAYRKTSYQRKSRRVQSSGSHCCSTGNQLDPGQKFILAQADPFEPRSFGGKIPDSSTIPSVPTPLQWNQSLTTAVVDPNRAHAWAFTTSLYSNFVTATGSTASTWAWNSAPAVSPSYTAYTNAFELYRPVAHAIRLSCPFAPTTTTGFVHIALATEAAVNTAGLQVASYTQLATSLSEMSGYTFYKRFTLASLTQNPITLVNKWTDESAFRYSSPNARFDDPADASTTPAANTSKAIAGASFAVPLSWGTLLVAVEGAQPSGGAVSITPLQAEVILHTEGIPQKSGVLIGSTAAAFDSGILNAVSQAQAGADFAHGETQQDAHMSQYFTNLANAAGNNPTIRQVANNVAGQVMNAGMNAVLNYMGGIPGVNANPNQLLIQ